MTNSPPLSPLTGGQSEKIAELSVDRIIELYRDHHGMDASEFFPDGVTMLDICRCRDTGYEFYAPLGLDGPPKFYEDLYASGGGDWGYLGDKWEHQFAATQLRKGDRVLDIGCGAGAFLEMAQNAGANTTGLETSAFGRERGQKKGLDIKNSWVEDFARDNAGMFDVVTSFQVLEHSSDPLSFLRSAVTLLKERGQLIIAVPDNDSFIRHADTNELNMPPHHVGLWRRESLEALPRLLPLELVFTRCEPLLPEKIDLYRHVMEHRYLSNSWLAKKLYYRLGGPRIANRMLEENRDSIRSDTIIAKFFKKKSAA